MASPFANLDALAQGAIDAAFGEAVTIIPRKAGQLSVTADPGRAPVATRAVVSVGAGSGSIAGQSTSEFRGVSRFQNAPAEAVISAAALAALPYQPRAGDLLRRDDEPGMPTYAISAPLPLSGELFLSLVAETWTPLQGGAGA